MIYPNWPQPNNIKAFTIGSKDLEEQFKANDVPKNIIWLNQIHGNAVCNLDNMAVSEDFLTTYAKYQSNKEIDELKKSLIACDASFTTKKQLACAIRTADCLPILITNLAGSKVAAIHAGWRGLLDEVIENTVREFKQDKENPLMAWIGPAICTEHFIVGPEVREQFIASQKIYAQAFQPCVSEPGKWQGNLQAIAQQKLRDLKIQNIYQNELCTYCEKESLDSYRRDGANSGRLITLIWRI